MDPVALRRQAFQQQQNRDQRQAAQQAAQRADYNNGGPQAGQPYRVPGGVMVPIQLQMPPSLEASQSQLLNQIMNLRQQLPQLSPEQAAVARHFSDPKFLRDRYNAIMAQGQRQQRAAQRSAQQAAQRRAAHEQAVARGLPSSLTEPPQQAPVGQTPSASSAPASMVQIPSASPAPAVQDQMPTKP